MPIIPTQPSVKNQNKTQNDFNFFTGLFLPLPLTFLTISTYGHFKFLQNNIQQNIYQFYTYKINAISDF